METNAAGDTVLTQWFERARFEDHGTKGVLLGLLGHETQPTPLVSGILPDLARGDTGPAVTHLQQRLNLFLLDIVRSPEPAPRQILVTGSFDAETEEVVGIFQAVEGLAKTGRVDFFVWARLTGHLQPNPLNGVWLTQFQETITFDFDQGLLKRGTDATSDTYEIVLTGIRPPTGSYTAIVDYTVGSRALGITPIPAHAGIRELGRLGTIQYENGQRSEALERPPGNLLTDHIPDDPAQ